jgi:hypothetical protein
MANKRSLGTRLKRWEVVILMAFLIDLFEDKVLFPAHGIPPWAKVVIKMATVVGLFGILLGFANKRLDHGLSAAHGAGQKTFVPGIVMHAIVFAALFTGIHWLKIGRWPWA